MLFGDKTMLVETEGADDKFLGPGSNPTVSPNKFHSGLVGNESLVLPPRQKLKEGLER